MKNNKIFNRTFKVSLVAMALGLVNSAWAIDYKLYEGTVYKNPERTDSEVKNMNFYSDYGYDLTNKKKLAQTQQDVSILGVHHLIGLSTKTNKHQLVMQLM